MTFTTVKRNKSVPRRKCVVLVAVALLVAMAVLSLRTNMQLRARHSHSRKPSSQTVQSNENQLLANGEKKNNGMPPLSCEKQTLTARKRQVAAAINPFFTILNQSGAVLQMDVVYTYVNESVRSWRQSFRNVSMKAAGLGASRRQRSASPQTMGHYRDWDELQYSLRSLGRSMCRDTQSALQQCGGLMLRTVHLVVADEQHVPHYINSSTVHIVTHEEIFPLKADDVTFNANAIESCIHRIPGLSRWFLYFNNDMLLGPGGSGANGKLHLQDLFHRVQDRTGGGGSAGSSGGVAEAFVFPKVMVETLDLKGECTAVVHDDGTCGANVSKTLQCQRTTSDTRRFINHNKQLVFERLPRLFEGYTSNDSTAVPRLTFAHLPRVFDRLLLKQMVEEEFGDVAERTRQHAFREVEDLFVPFVYNFFAFSQRYAFVAGHTQVRGATSSGASSLLHSLVDAGHMQPSIVAAADGGAKVGNFLSLLFQIEFMLGRTAYYFGQIRSLENIAAIKMELGNQLNKTLFITLNDDIQHLGGGGGLQRELIGSPRDHGMKKRASLGKAKLQRAIAGLLSMIGGDVASEWEL